MLPVSSKELVRFTPESSNEEEAPPVYLLQPATLKQRTRFEEVLAANGVIAVSDAQFFDSVRDAVRALIPQEHQPQFIELLGEAEHRVQKHEPFDPDLQAQMDELELEMAELWPPFAKLRARRIRRLAMMPIVACQMFLKGAENIGFELKFSGGMLTDDTLDLFPPGHVNAIGWKAVALTYLGKEAEKNSASLSPSTSSPTTSATE